MAKKKETKETEEGIVVDVAKAIGTAAGKVAAMFTGTPTPPRKRIGKLPKKNKSRLPRKEKKAQQKARRVA
jgi:hypothetical protein